MEKNYEAQLEMYRKIVEHMAESVWIGDENERTVYANPNFCKLIGYSLDEMIGRESYDFRDHESAKTVASNNVLRKEGEASKYEGILRSKDGTLIPVACSGTPIPWGGTVGIMTDLREVKSLQRAKEELDAINKMKDEFISIVGHELRTPLTIIKGYLSMFLDGDMGEINSVMQKSMKQSYDSTNAMIGLVNDMLDLSKIESWKMKFYDESILLWDLLLGVYNDFSLLAKEKKFDFVFENDIWELSDTTVYIDSNKLKQVLINLLSNAFKFTPVSGKISLGITQENDYFLVFVRDTGIGMSQEKIGQIFEKFFQIDSSFRRTTDGLWLGLSISQSIMKHYQSEIQVSSVEGQGTKFWFQLKKHA